MSTTASVGKTKSTQSVAVLDRFERSVNWILKWLFAAGLALAGLIMALLFVAGFKLFWDAIVIFFGRAAAKVDVEPKAFALVEALKGLEYFFLAPLGYLVFLTMIRFVRSTISGDFDELADKRIRNIKSLTMSLLIAVIATDLVSKILGPQGLGRDSAIAEILVMGALIGYYVLLERKLDG